MSTTGIEQSTPFTKKLKSVLTHIASLARVSSVLCWCCWISTYFDTRTTRTLAYKPAPFHLKNDACIKRIIASPELTDNSLSSHQSAWAMLRCLDRTHLSLMLVHLQLQTIPRPRSPQPDNSFVNNHMMVKRLLNPNMKAPCEETKACLNQQRLR